MPAVKQNQFAELDSQTASLRKQLDAKSSLFDVLSPPPDREPDPAAIEDNQLKSAMRSGMVYSHIILALGIAALAIGSGTRWGSFASPLMIIASDGISVSTGMKLLRKRTIALESEVRKLRGQLSALQRSQPDERNG